MQRAWSNLLVIACGLTAVFCASYYYFWKPIDLGLFVGLTGLGALLGCFLAVFFYLSRYDTMLNARFHISLAVAVGILFLAHSMEMASSNSQLEQYFAANPPCNSLIASLPVSFIAERGKAIENQCYLHAFRKELLNRAPTDQVDYLNQTLMAVRDANRWSDQWALGIADALTYATISSRPSFMDSRLTLDEYDLLLANELVTLSELPLSLKSSAIELIVRAETIFKNKAVDDGSRATVVELAQRVVKVKDRWIITESQLQDYNSERVARHEQM